MDNSHFAEPAAVSTSVPSAFPATPAGEAIWLSKIASGAMFSCRNKLVIGRGEVVTEVQVFVDGALQ
jgi:hypothetical protein